MEMTEDTVEAAKVALGVAATVMVALKRISWDFLSSDFICIDGPDSLRKTYMNCILKIYCKITLIIKLVL